MQILQNPRVYMLLIAVAVFTSAQMALQTRFDAHPDEIWHARGFCYFEGHTWLPDLNSDDVDYDVYGYSRVFSGELVYLVYGKLALLIKPFVEPLVRPTQFIAIQPPLSQSYFIFLPMMINTPTPARCLFVFQVYRLLNTALYLVTLVVLFAMGRKKLWATAIAAVLLCLPQVVYIYSYANSDAWGISFSLFVFIFALTREQIPLSRRNLIGLGFLTSLVLLSKPIYWIGLPLAYLYLFWHYAQ